MIARLGQIPFRTILPGSRPLDLPRRVVLVRDGLFLVATVMAVVQSGLGPGALVVVLTVIVAATIWLVVEPEDRTILATATMTLFLARALFAGLLHAVLLRVGNHGAMFYDDLGYSRMAAEIAHRWQGRPVDPEIAPLLNDPSFNTTYVTAAGGVLWLFGTDPLAITLVNTALATIAALLIYRTMKNLGVPGARWALLLSLVFPTIVLWSALALKEAYVLFFMCAAMWIVSEFVRTRNYLWFLAMVGVLLSLENVRVYVYAVLIVAWPIALLLSTTRWTRVGSSALAAVIGVFMLADTPALANLMNPGITQIPSFIRSAMANDARTSFTEPLPAGRGNEGDEFVVTLQGTQPSLAPDARVVDVTVGQPIVVVARPPEPASPTPEPTPSQSGGPSAPPRTPAPARTAPPQAPSGAAIVQPGDIVRIVSASPSPGQVASSASPTPRTTSTATPFVTSTPAVGATIATPTPSQPPALMVSTVGKNVIATPIPADVARLGSTDELQASGGVQDSLQHLPVGFFYVLTAPLPFSARTALDLASIPEMLLWYATVILAIAGTVWLIRRRDLRYAYGAAAATGIALVLALFEGNVGTLFRHRTMLEPFVIPLAAVGWVTWPALRRIAPVRTLLDRI